MRSRRRYREPRDARAALAAVVPSALDRPLPPATRPRYLGERSGAEGLVTLGAWGSSPGDDLMTARLADRALRAKCRAKATFALAPEAP